MNAAAITKILLQADRVVIMGHKRGDVDCYGSSFALSMALTAIGKDSEIISDEKYPSNLDFLFNYFSGAVVPVATHKFDTFVILDTSDLDRTAVPALATDYLESAEQLVLVDHHTKGDLTESISNSLCMEDVSSTSELVFEIIQAMGVEIDKNIASLLLAGIIADTSSFQNQNTTGRSLEISSELLKYGARKKTIISQLFGGSEVDALKLWGLAMGRLNLNKKYGAVSSYLTYEDISSCGISGDAISGIVNYLNQVEGAKMIVLVTEEEKGQIKVSFRTRDNNMDVSSLARQLGGGGHVKASGLTFDGTIIETDTGVAVY
jgi:bifunctional oligoribonuclease and PAP phosphatase NrnA